MFAGCIEIQITDKVRGFTFPALIVYPTGEIPHETFFGPYSFDVSMAAKISEGSFPLVVISHGGGGSHLLYRTIALHLAKNGYIVAMPEQPGNNRNNNELAGTYENLVNRPAHISLTIDVISSDPRFRSSVRTNSVAIIGHSLGGYTALAVAGGIPWSKVGKRVEVTKDSRVQALVLLAPAAAFFIPADSLKDVTVPILMLVAEHDSITPLWQAELVVDGVPDRSRVTWRIVKNAGHFSFLSPFPARMRNQGLPPTMDPDGFDREKFHEQLPDEVLQFLNAKIKAP